MQENQNNAMFNFDKIIWFVSTFFKSFDHINFTFFEELFCIITSLNF